MKKLTFQKFIEEISNSIKSYLPKEYADASIGIQRISKPGGKTLTGIVIQRLFQNISPIIYLNNAYQRYCDGTGIDAILTELATTIQKEATCLPDMCPYLSWKIAKDLIVSRFVNVELNSAYIADRPVTPIAHSSIGIIYDIELSHLTNQEMTAAVTFKMMEQWGVTIQDLDIEAQKNTPRIRPARIQSLGQILSDAIADTNIQENDLLYVITNVGLCQGAVTVTYPGLEDQLREKLGDFHLISSSIHEMLAVSQAVMGPDELAQLIQSINSSQVAPEDVLDNQHTFWLCCYTPLPYSGSIKIVQSKDAM